MFPVSIHGARDEEAMTGIPSTDFRYWASLPSPSLSLTFKLPGQFYDLTFLPGGFVSFRSWATSKRYLFIELAVVMGPGVYLVDPYGPGPPHQHAPQHHPPPPPDRNPDPRRLGSPRPWRAPGALPTSTRGSRWALSPRPVPGEALGPRYCRQVKHEDNTSTPQRQSKLSMI